MQVACIVHASYIDGEAGNMYLPVVGGCDTVSCLRLTESYPACAPFMEKLFSVCSRFNAFALTHEEIALFCAVLLNMPGNRTSSSSDYNPGDLQGFLSGSGAISK